MEQEVKLDSTLVQSEQVESHIEVNRTPEEYARRLKEVSEEAKQFRKKNAELASRLDDFEKQKLTEQGKYQELYTTANKRAEEAEKSSKRMQAQYAYKAVTSEVAKEAIKMGCIDTEALIKLSSINDLDVKDDFSVDESSIKSMLEEMAKSKPYLFSRAAPQVRDGTPAKTGDVGLKDLTLDQKLKLLANKMSEAKT